ncbi:MAG: hypothetical protein ABIM20_05870 [candidate division WOR-3 bacterium]
MVEKVPDRELEKKLYLLFLGDFISNFYTEYEKDCVEDLIESLRIKNILEKLNLPHLEYFRRENFYQFLHEFNLYVITYNYPDSC